MASEEMIRQQDWTEYCERGLALNALSSEATFSGEEQKQLDATEATVSSVLETVLEFDVNKKQDDLHARQMAAAVVEDVVNNIIDDILKDITYIAPGQAPPRPPRRSYLSFEEEPFDLKEELALVSATPESFDHIEQGFEDLLLEVVDDATTDAGEPISTDSSDEISHLALDDVTVLTYLQRRDDQLSNRDDLTNDWLSRLPGPCQTCGACSWLDPPVTSSSPESVHGGYGPGSYVDLVQSPRWFSAPSSPIPDFAEFDDQSQPDLVPTHILLIDQSPGTDKIEANIADPRYHAAQVPELLKPLYDIGEQMDRLSLGASYAEYEDPVLSRAPRAPRAMRSAAFRALRPGPIQRYLDRQPRFRQQAYFIQAEIEAREVNNVKAQA